MYMKTRLPGTSGSKERRLTQKNGDTTNCVGAGVLLLMTDHAGLGNRIARLAFAAASLSVAVALRRNGASVTATVLAWKASATGSIGGPSRAGA